MLAGVICVTFVGCGRTGVNAVETTEQETEAVLETEAAPETEAASETETESEPSTQAQTVRQGVSDPQWYSVAGTDEEQTDATGSISVSNESYSMNGWSISFEVRNSTDKTINKIEPVFVMTAQVGNLKPSGTFELSSQDGVYVFSIEPVTWRGTALS